MGKYEMLRQMREAEAAAAERRVTEHVTKPIVRRVTKPRAGVNKGGRPCIGAKAMTAAERKRRQRQKKRWGRVPL